VKTILVGRCLAIGKTSMELRKHGGSTVIKVQVWCGWKLIDVALPPESTVSEAIKAAENVLACEAPHARVIQKIGRKR